MTEKNTTIESLIEADPVIGAMRQSWGNEKAIELMTEAIKLRDKLRADGWEKKDFAKALAAATTRASMPDDSLPTDPLERYHYFGRLDGENDANNGDVIPVDDLQDVSEAAIIKWQMAEGLEPFTVEESIHLSDAYARGYAAQVPVITGQPYFWPE